MREQGGVVVFIAILAFTTIFLYAIALRALDLARAGAMVYMRIMKEAFTLVSTLSEGLMYV